MDAVAPVHVGVPRRAEHRPVARRGAGMGVRGGLAPVVGLGLDDDAAAAVDEQGAADQVRCDLADGALEECPVKRPGQAPAGPWMVASRSAASSTCAARLALEVPPSIFFDSSQLDCFSTS